MTKWLPALALQACALAAIAQTPVHIEVDAAHTTGVYKPVWNYFGADEPNYATEPDGRKLLHELAQLPTAAPAPVYFRAHNLLTSGDGKGSLKWGSTNVYTEDAAGNPVYDFTITDRIFDAYKAAGITPLVEVSFTPEALSPHPQPYRHNFPEGGTGSMYTGWAYPPKDFARWATVVQTWAAHLRDRYGPATGTTWLWEVWNEPDIAYWKGTPEEYLALYDYTADAIRKAIPNARVGGPESTGPYNQKGMAYLARFLDHCAHGTNAATGGTGAPLAFISFHPKGSPRVVDGHVQMGIRNQLSATDNGFKTVAASPEFKHTPIIMGEFDPEGCAACSGANLGYRNGPLYGVSVAEAMARIQELAIRDGVNLQGAVTWAFEFEGQPWFAGYRDLATNGVDKPVLNAFRMLGMLSGDTLAVHSSAALPVDTILKDGVRNTADINAIATRTAHQVTVLIYNYSDDDLPAAIPGIALQINGLKARRVTARQFRMDATHSNAYAAWQAMGSPQKPTQQQVDALEKASKLETVGQPVTLATQKGTASLEFELPRQGVELVQISW